MRQIKFRGKRLDNGDWVHGSYAIRLDGAKFIMSIDNYDTHCINPETVGQFTGLNDKNGVEIYEGDILQMWLDDSVESNRGLFYQMYVMFTVEKGFVLWGERMTIEDAEPLYEMLQWKECEIIGNIHDNPELKTTEQ